MSNTTPATPPPAAEKPKDKLSKQARLLLISVGVFIALTFILRLTGLLCPFQVPTGAMAPTIAPGDRVLMERFSLLSRPPHRGDLVIFDTTGIAGLQPNSVFVERVAGEPGETLQLVDGKILVNEKPMTSHSSTGEIYYVHLPQSTYLTNSTAKLTVPADSYFVLGDNSNNSFDGRFWGFVPAKNIRGLATYCYWPLNRARRIK